MEIIASESGIDLENTTYCEKAEHKNEITLVYESENTHKAEGKFGAGKLIKIHEGTETETLGNP
jgi:hypothetical protein